MKKNLVGILLVEALINEKIKQLLVRVEQIFIVPLRMPLRRHPQELSFLLRAPIECMSLPLVGGARVRVSVYLAGLLRGLLLEVLPPRPNGLV